MYIFIKESLWRQHNIIEKEFAILEFLLYLSYVYVNYIHSIYLIIYLYLVTNIYYIFNIYLVYLSYILNFLMYNFELYLVSYVVHIPQPLFIP